MARFEGGRSPESGGGAWPEPGSGNELGLEAEASLSRVRKLTLEGAGGSSRG